MSRLNRLILCCVVVFFWLAPDRLAGQEQTTDAEKVSESDPSRLWAVIGGSWVRFRADCTFCENFGIEARTTYTWGIVGDIGVRVNNKTDAGLEVAWIPTTTRAGTPFRATFLLGIVQFRPWESQGFFVKGGMGMAFTRNFLTEEEDTLTQKALAVAIGGGWTFRPEKRVGFQLHGNLHVAALGDFVVGEELVLENVMGNFWSLGGAVVIR